MNPMDLGHLLEGTLEQDPITDRFTLRTTDELGRPVTVDLQDLLGKYLGQEVRFTLVSFESIQKLKDLVEEAGGMDQVTALSVPFNVRKSG